MGGNPALFANIVIRGTQARSGAFRRRVGRRWELVIAGRKLRVLAIEAFDRLVGAEGIALPGRRRCRALPGAGRIERRD